jgi:hypothetical protein
VPVHPVAVAAAPSHAAAIAVHDGGTVVGTPPLDGHTPIAAAPHEHAEHVASGACSPALAAGNACGNGEAQLGAVAAAPS